MFNFTIGETPDNSGDILDAYESAISQLPKQRQRTIRESAARELLNAYPLHVQKPVWTGKGEDLFFDSWSKMRFYSSFQHVETILNNTKKRLEKIDPRVPISDIYDGWGVPYSKRMKNIGFIRKLDYEIKVVQHSGFTQNVILFITRPKPF